MSTMANDEVLTFRDEALAYVRSQMQPEEKAGWTQISLSLRPDEAQLLTDVAERLGWTKRKTFTVALSALQLMAHERTTDP